MARLFLGPVIAVAATSVAAPVSADPVNPFSHLCRDSRCSKAAPGTVSHEDIAQVKAGIQQGWLDMQSAVSPGQ
jgi:hypothetical protein